MDHPPTPDRFPTTGLAAGLALALLVLLPGAALRAQESPPEDERAVPAHPDDLTYPELDYEAPDPRDHRVTLDNGAVAYIVEDHQAPYVSIGIRLRGGSILDPEGKEGLARMAGALLRTGGTEEMAPDALDERLDVLAASISTSFGTFAGRASMWCLSRNLDEVLDLFGEVLLRPRFAEERQELYRSRRLESLRGRNDSTRSIERREFDGLVHGEHPVNRLETEGSIRAIETEDLRAFHRRVVPRPENMVISCVGDFERSAMVDRLEALLPSPPEDAEPLPEIPVPEETAGEAGVYLVDRPDVNQGRVSFGHLGIRKGDPDEVPLLLLNHVLGGGSFTSRLTSRVRSDEGLAYSVGSRYAGGTFLPGAFRVAFQSKTESVSYALELCLEEVERIREEGVTEGELERARSYYVESFPETFGSREDIAETFARAEFQGRSLDHYATLRDRIRSVTVEDVNRVARERIHPGEFVAVVVGPADGIREGDEEHEASLESLGPVRVIEELPAPLEMTRPAVLDLE